MPSWHIELAKAWPKPRLLRMMDIMRKSTPRKGHNAGPKSPSVLAIICKMTSDRSYSAEQPFCGADLERWRVENGLSKVAAADAFGLQKAKWEKLTNPLRSKEPLTDPTLGLLLQVYNQHPKSAPVRHPPNVVEFYEWLGLQGSTQDRETFATLIGRAPPSAWRLLLHDGRPSRPVVCWIEAVQRLDLSPRQTLKLMADVVSTVGTRQGNPKVLLQGWSEQSDANNED